MKLARLCAIAILPLGLAACGGDDAELEEGVVLTDTAVAPVTAPAADAAASAMATQVTMSPVGSATTTGTAMVTAAGSSTEVTVQLTGLSEGAHAGHIHQGTCDAPGSPVAPLQDATAGADQSATVTSTAEVDPMSVMDGNHIIMYHESSSPPGAPVVCGQIPGHTM